MEEVNLGLFPLEILEKILEYVNDMKGYHSFCLVNRYLSEVGRQERIQKEKRIQFTRRVVMKENDIDIERMLQGNIKHGIEIHKRNGSIIYECPWFQNQKHGQEIGHWSEIPPNVLIMGDQVKGANTYRCTWVFGVKNGTEERIYHGVIETQQWLNGMRHGIEKREYISNIDTTNGTERFEKRIDLCRYWWNDKLHGLEERFYPLGTRWPRCRINWNNGVKDGFEIWYLPATAREDTGITEPSRWKVNYWTNGVKCPLRSWCLTTGGNHE